MILGVIIMNGGVQVCGAHLIASFFSNTFERYSQLVEVFMISIKELKQSCV